MTSLPPRHPPHSRANKCSRQTSQQASTLVIPLVVHPFRPPHTRAANTNVPEPAAPIAECQSTPQGIFTPLEEPPPPTTYNRPSTKKKKTKKKKNIKCTREGGRCVGKGICMFKLATLSVGNCIR